MQNKKQPKQDDMRKSDNKKQYTNVANRDLLREFRREDNVQPKTDNVTRKGNSESR